jgi:hypothetical protein
MKAGNQPGPNLSGDDMPQYLFAGYLPDEYDPSTKRPARPYAILTAPAAGWFSNVR